MAREITSPHTRQTEGLMILCCKIVFYGLNNPKFGLTGKYLQTMYHLIDRLLLFLGLIIISAFSINMYVNHKK